MKTFKEFLEENMTGKQIPLKLRKSTNGQQIFCPKCGYKFIYYKEKTKCRGCGQHIINDLGMPAGNMMEGVNFEKLQKYYASTGNTIWYFKDLNKAKDFIKILKTHFHGENIGLDNKNKVVYMDEDIFNRAPSGVRDNVYDNYERIRFGG